jgi:hypothetical protein
MEAVGFSGSGGGGNTAASGKGGNSDSGNLGLDRNGYLYFASASWRKAPGLRFGIYAVKILVQIL